MEEVQNLYDSMCLIENLKYSSGIEVVEIVSTYGETGAKTLQQIEQYNDHLCQDGGLHYIRNVEYSWYCLSSRTDIIKNIIDDYLLVEHPS